MSKNSNSTHYLENGDLVVTNPFGTTVVTGDYESASNPGGDPVINVSPVITNQIFSHGKDGNGGRN